jgi:hypothetical protein
MRSFLITLALFMGYTSARPVVADPDCDAPVLNNLTGPYTLTAFAPFSPLFNGLKVNDLNLFQSMVYQYCPFTGNQSNLCPNGTDMAFGGSLYPVSPSLSQSPCSLIRLSNIK